MSLKVTIELNGQTEQQLTPVIGQVLARYSSGVNAQENTAEPTQSHRVYPDQSALLQQQIQQLVTQNQMLQVQLSQSQRRLASVPAAKAFLPAPEQSGRSPATSAGTLSRSAGTHQSKTGAPPLPAQYQTGSSKFVFGRIKRSLGKLPVWLWCKLVRLSFGQERLLVFLLLCGGLYGAWTIGFKLTEQFIAIPEFVESADDGPGDTAAPENGAGTEKDSPADTAPPQTSPAPSTSKAGSHPPPPPAFEEP